MLPQTCLPSSLLGKPLSSQVLAAPQGGGLARQAPGRVAECNDRCGMSGCANQLSASHIRCCRPVRPLNLALPCPSPSKHSFLPFPRPCCKQGLGRLHRYLEQEPVFSLVGLSSPTPGLPSTSRVPILSPILRSGSGVTHPPSESW